MNATLHCAAWLATVWFHSMLLSLLALGIAWGLCRRNREFREVAWKMALVGGIVTGSVQWGLEWGGWESLGKWRQAVTVGIGAMPRGGELWTANGGSRGEAQAGSAVELASSGGAAVATDRSESGSLWRLSPWFGVGLTLCFGIGLACGMVRVCVSVWGLRQLLARSRHCGDVELVELIDSLRRQIGVPRAVESRVSDEIWGPLAAGILRPRILIPALALDGRLDRQQLAGLFAHELAHHARWDPLWALIGHLVTHAWWFQPLGHVVRRCLRRDAEYRADELACRALGGGLGLARCLAAMAEWVAARRMPRAEIGTVPLFTWRSTLRDRVESLLAVRSTPVSQGGDRRWRRGLGIVGISFLVVATAPSFRFQFSPPSTSGDKPMHRTLAALTIATALNSSALADEPATPAKAELAREAPKLQVPASSHGFSGELAGTVVSKDTDGAKLVMKVQQVRQVWKNSKAERPKDLVGRTVPVEEFFGRFLDVLLVVKPGDTVLLEAKHVRGDRLQFLGETFQKIDALPEGDGKSTKPDGDRVGERDEGKFPEGLRGFRGIFVGQVVKADAEQGTLQFRAESVKNVWPQNKAKDPASCKGRLLTVQGIAGKWLDVLLVLKAGDRIEVEAFHNRGEALDFVQEWLKKVE